MPATLASAVHAAAWRRLQARAARLEDLLIEAVRGTPADRWGALHVVYQDGFAAPSVACWVPGRKPPDPLDRAAVHAAPEEADRG